MTPALVRRFEACTAAGLSLIVLISAGVRSMHAAALWRDECGAVQLAGLPRITDVLHNFPHEAFPPPFFILIRTWIAICGNTDLAVRVYGFVVAVGFVAALWFAVRLPSGTIPLLSLGCVGLSSTFLVFGTSLRGYGIGTCCILFTFGFVGRLLVAPDRLTGALAMLASIISVQLLVQNTVLVFAIALSAVMIGVGRRKWRQASTVVTGLLIALLSFTPYLPAYLRAADWSLIVQPFGKQPGFLNQLNEFFGSIHPLGYVAIGLYVLAAAIVAGRQIYSNRDKSEQPPEVVWFCVLALFLPFAASEIFFRALNYAHQPWYLLAPIAVCVVAADILFARVSDTSWLRFARLGLAVVAAGCLSVANWPKLMERQTNVDLAARVVAQKAIEQDLILVNPWQLGISFHRYYNGGSEWITLPRIEDHQIHRYDLVKTKMMSARPIEDVLESVAATLRSGNRLWLVGGARFPSPDEPFEPLAPAPESRFGWDNVAYVRSWSTQLGQFLQHHAGSVKRLPLAQSARVSPVENVSLIVAEGWKE